MSNLKFIQVGDSFNAIGLNVVWVIIGLMRVVFYHGVGSHVFMDSFFVTGVDPKAIMSQNEEAIEKFCITLSRTS